MGREGVTTAYWDILCRALSLAPSSRFNPSVWGGRIPHRGDVYDPVLRYDSIVTAWRSAHHLMQTVSLRR